MTPSTTQKPSIGRIVHFVSDRVGQDVPVAAVITRVWTDTCVNLRLFNDGENSGISGHLEMATEWKTSVSYDEKEVPDMRTWHWPPKV